MNQSAYILFSYLKVGHVYLSAVRIILPQLSTGDIETLPLCNTWSEYQREALKLANSTNHI